MSDNGPFDTDPADMVSVHQVFRAALGAAPTLMRAVSPDDGERVAAIGSFYANVLAFLHVHNGSEEELLWPRLLERCPSEAELINRVAGQRRDIDALVSAVTARLAEWTAAPSVAHGDQLAAALATLDADLTAHLDDEEKLIFPLAARYISAVEWGELAAYGMRHFTGDKLWLILGLVQETMTPPQREAMITHMPFPVRAFWASAGRPKFESFIAGVRH
jgi:hemerythrin-like domain-containing protein